MNDRFTYRASGRMSRDTTKLHYITIKRNKCNANNSPFEVKLNTQKLTNLKEAHCPCMHDRKIESVHR